MATSLIELTQRAAADWGVAAGVGTAVFGFSERGFVGTGQRFCQSCALVAQGRCDPPVAHRFGCYEAERWSGQYIYYCPASLVFIATLVSERDIPVYGVVAGPLVMGSFDDLEADLLPEMRVAVASLPRRSSAEVSALARVQQGLCAAQALPEPPPATSHPSPPAEPAYPLEFEQRLVGMIRRGDRAGAAELINDLLGVLYLAYDRDFPRLKQGATDLITVFSRAAIEGGADAGSIFGEKEALDRRLAGLRTTTELSGFLALAFDRFVSYVFDFSRFRHANTLHQVVNYIRTHYADHIALGDVARLVWLSPSYLSAIFSAEMGMSLTAYVQTVRIAKSKELLRTTRLSVADVAARTGFADQSYFTKVFTRAEGRSPTMYRREQRDG